MHDVGEPLDGHVFFYFHRPKLADLSDIIPSQIHQHIVLGPLFFVCQQFFFQPLVFLFRGSSWPGACQREGVKRPILQLHQRLRGSSGNLHIVTGKIKHVRRRIQCSQYPVGIEKASFIVCFQPVGKHHLENIALPDIVLGFLHHIAVPLFVKERPEIGSAAARFHRSHLPVGEEPSHGFQFHLCLVVFRLQILTADVDDEDDLLPEMVKSDNLVKEHQVHIFKPFFVLCIQLQGRFCVFHVIVGEISYQSAGEGGHSFQSWAFVFFYDLPDILAGMLGLKHHGRSVFDGQCSVRAGQLQLRVVTQKRVAPPLFIVLDGFQHIAVSADPFQFSQYFNGSVKIRVQLRAHRNAFVNTLRCQCGSFLKIRSDVHGVLLS